MTDDVPIALPKVPFVEKTHPKERGGFSASALCLVDGYPAEFLVDIEPRYDNYRAHIRKFTGLEWVIVYSMNDYEITAKTGPLPTGDALLDWVNEIAKELWYTADKIAHAARLRNDAVDCEADFKKRAYMGLDAQPDREIAFVAGDER